MGIHGEIKKNPGMKRRFTKDEVGIVKELENQGLILFVPKVGWVDTEDAVQRSQRHSQKEEGQ